MNLIDSSPVDVDKSLLSSHPFLREPADPEDIKEAETRLGIKLPQDLKDFFLVTDGVGFSGNESIPELASIKELAWVSTADAGLDSLSELIDIPGLEELTNQELDAIPSLQRALILSDEDEESTVGLLDPAFIRQASRTVHEMRQLPWEEPEEPIWM